LTQTECHIAPSAEWILLGFLFTFVVCCSCFCFLFCFL
jgi:hypothetical protein